jgi:pSer/pThr/pTyr-binding forkhead associated (FHA) protein
VEGKEILIVALTLTRDRFVEKFPDLILVGESAFDRTLSNYGQETAPPQRLTEALPTHIVFTIPEVRRAVQRRFTLGRASDNDLVIVHDTVSKLHAYLENTNGSQEWALSDAGSRNGTWIGNERLPVGGPSREVRPGMCLRLGEVTLTVVDSGAFWDRLRRR